MDKISLAVVRTEDGSLTVRHDGYDEEFHSRQGARSEAESLYRDASGFREHLFQSSGQGVWLVLDVGLGLGYNALMSLETWWLAGGPVDFKLVSLEHTRLLVQSLADPACSWKEGWSESWMVWSQALTEQSDTLWSATWTHPVSGRRFDWEVQIGDAREALLTDGGLLYIWQDAFSPKKNPELWTADWFKKLRLASRPDVCLVTYSVARVVKDALASAGWDWVRVRASEHKKQWLKARLSRT